MHHRVPRHRHMLGGDDDAPIIPTRGRNMNRGREWRRKKEEKGKGKVRVCTLKRNNGKITCIAVGSCEDVSIGLGSSKQSCPRRDIMPCVITLVAAFSGRRILPVPPTCPHV